jgi:hypothetical protein
MASKYRTVGKALTTSNQDVYTVPAQWSATVSSICISNTSDASVTVSLDWYSAADTAYHSMMEQVTLPAYSMLQITDALYLQKNDKIRALASANSSVEVSVMVAEQAAA